MTENQRSARGSKWLEENDFGRWSSLYIEKLTIENPGPRFKRRSIEEYQAGLEFYFGEE